MKKNKELDEYYFLLENLQEVNDALEGSCNDIDCKKYMYRDLLKKKYRPVLEHEKSCFPKLQREKAALLGLLSLQKFRTFRYKKCEVCKKNLDTLGKSYTIISFTKPSRSAGKKFHDYKGVEVHKMCEKKIKTPKGWKKA